MTGTSRKWAWTAMLVGGGVYQASKPIFGFVPNFEALVTSLYWGGTALLIHWVANRATEPRP